MATKIIDPKNNQLVRPVGFTAYGTTDSALKAKRIRGMMIGKTGAVYVGVPVKPIKTTWGLAFFNPLAKGMKPGDYVLQIFDFLGPLKILAKVSFRVRFKVIAKTSYPVSGDSVPRIFFASGATSGTLLGGTMTCRLKHQFAGTNPVTLPDGSWTLGFNISESDLHNMFTLDVNDDVTGTDTQPNITVMDSNKKMK
jgi:hypothetical protein